MRICIDIDNTIRDCATPMIKLYNEYCDENFTIEDICDYNMDIAFPKLKEWGINTFDFFFKDHIDETMTNAHPYPRVKEVIDELRNRGHKIIIVSYQPNTSAKISAIMWLDKNHINYDDIIFTNSPSKTTMSISCDYIIDDRPEYLDEVKETRCKSICVDFAYNRNRDYNYRIKSFTELLNIIK